MTFKVWLVRARQGDRRARWRKIQRPDIQVGDLPGGKQREATLATNGHGNIVRDIKMRRRGHLIADP